MTIKEILEMLFEDRGPIIMLFLIATTLVEIAPIKLNPWKKLLKWFGSLFNSDVMMKLTDVDHKVGDIETRLNDHIKASDEMDLKARRSAILDFASNLMRGQNYHKEKFEFMIRECDSYEKYCRDNGVINGVADASITEIRRIHAEKLRTNGFLSDHASAPETKEVNANGS